MRGIRKNCSVGVDGKKEIGREGHDSGEVGKVPIMKLATELDLVILRNG
jgi:hypothetical protein